MNSRPFVASHMSTGTYTSALGVRLGGRVNTVADDGLDAAMAPWKWTTPLMDVAAGFAVPKPVALQPLTGVRVVTAPDCRNETPSREVKQSSLEVLPSCSSTSTTPFGAMMSRPLVAPHMSTGT